MFDVWSVVQWWEEWQLRILVLGSLGIQWFLLVAAPMRKYTIPLFFRTCIWLAYVSSDALAIYALATLFNRHAKATTSSSCDGIASKGSILEVLWAPVLLIHLGGQEELTAYTIEDNELWTRHAVTLVSQVAVALYAFYKSWPSSSDWKLLASAILLFIIGVASFSEKPWALKRARISRLASVSATIQGTKGRSRWGVYLDDLMFSDWYKCFTKSEDEDTKSEDEAATGGHWYNCFKGEPSGGQKKTDGKSGVVLSDADKVFMILSDMSLSATADDLVQRQRAGDREDVLGTLGTKALYDSQRWLRGAFGFIYTRANVVVHPAYLVYHLLAVPTLHIAALTLFAISDKHGFSRADVKITYILLCFTAALDVLAVFIRQLLYRVMSIADVPPLCQTIPDYNLVDEAVRRAQHKKIGWLVAIAKRMGFKKECLECRAGEKYRTFKLLTPVILGDLVDVDLKEGRDLATYRTFTAVEVDHVEPVWLSAGEPVELDHVEIVSLGAGGLPNKKSLSTKPNQPAPPCDRHERQKHEEPAGSRAAGSSSSFTATKHNRPAAPSKSDDEAQLQHAETCGPAAATARWYQEPKRVTGEELRQEAAGKKSPRTNWALREELQSYCGTEIRRTLRGSFDRSVLVWHIATDLCSRYVDLDSSDTQRSYLTIARMKWAKAISNYMAHLLNSRPEMLLTGSRQHLVTEAMRELKTVVENSGQPRSPGDIKKIIEKYKGEDIIIEKFKGKGFFHIPQACKLANELMHLDDDKRARVMYRVWLGMLCYSASMCRGYLHAKSLAEGGEFLSFIWLVLSLKGANTLADKLQMPEDDESAD
ncbi:unnamed protein product [Urochloa decumbens]|uniref:DUF4220 domain-containing protein n=1 Tax=Urochloa decumbens TaxID=240449 RepID=A0ABC9B694_9POAL